MLVYHFMGFSSLLPKMFFSQGHKTRDVRSRRKQSNKRFVPITSRNFHLTKTILGMNGCRLFLFIYESLIQFS